MKRISALLMTILLALVLAGCGNTERGESSAPSEPNQTPNRTDAVPTDTTSPEIAPPEDVFEKKNLYTFGGFYVPPFDRLWKNAQDDDSAIQTDAPHNFSGHPGVYLTADVSAQGLLSAYEALEPAENGTVGVKLSETLWPHTILYL